MRKKYLFVGVFVAFFLVLSQLSFIVADSPIPLCKTQDYFGPDVLVDVIRTVTGTWGSSTDSIVSCEYFFEDGGRYLEQYYWFGSEQEECQQDFAASSPSAEYTIVPSSNTCDN